VDGILNINKPGGQTSFSVVALVKRLSGERRVGHGGTLDPLATGVLPVCLGRGTRIVEYLMDTTKSYRAEIELGIATDTYDADGQVIQQGDATNIDLGKLESALALFQGSISQVPPMYSAVKHHGRPLYQLARAGIQVERRSRLAKIYKLEIIDWQPPVVTIEVECGKGTYIRSLAHDLGQYLGCGAYLKGLTRLRTGFFDITDAVSIPQLEEAFYNDCWQRLVYPVDIVLQHWKAMVVGKASEDIIRNGGSVNLTGGDITPSVDEERCRAYTLDGHFLGILRLDAGKGEWQPEKVFL